MLLIAAFTVLGNLGTAQTAGLGYGIHFTPAGQAAARAALPTQIDVGASWKGGRVKPDLSDDVRCLNYRPKTSDLVMTGAASVKFKHAGIELTGEAHVLETAEMVLLDWQRSIRSSNYLTCVRTSLRRLFGTKKGKIPGKLISVNWRSLPRDLAPPRAAAIRSVISVDSKHNGTVRLAIDLIAIVRGKTEISLTTSMPLASAAAMWRNEIVLARVVASRVPA